VGKGVGVFWERYGTILGEVLGYFGRGAIK